MTIPPKLRNKRTNDFNGFLIRTVAFLKRQIKKLPLKLSNQKSNKKAKQSYDTHCENPGN